MIAARDGDSSEYFANMFKSDTPYASSGDDVMTSRHGISVLPFYHFSRRCDRAGRQEVQCIKKAFIIPGNAVAGFYLHG